MSDTRSARFQAESARLGYDFGGKLQVGGNYVPTLKHKGVLYVSGQVPRVGSEVVVAGNKLSTSDDGTIQGRLPQDDDFDMNMLKKVNG